MNMDLKNRETKKMGINRFKNSFKYSIAGLKYAYKYEQSMTIHFFMTALVIILGVFFKVSIAEWAILLILIGIILATELINTALEALVDLVSPDYHELAKVAKDCASAAVFVYSIVAALIGLVVFVPKILELLF